jgi:hydroxypyruvate isomerase
MKGLGKIGAIARTTMNRRTFSQTLARGAVGAAALGSSNPLSAAPASSPAEESPFKISVMMWTVFHGLPFEARLEKVAEAGYKAVQLVNETASWSEDDFRRYNRKRRELGIIFDTTCSVKHGVGDPSVRDAFLADVREQLKVMEKIECPKLIVMSGNVIPGLAPEAQHASCVEGMKRAADLIEGKGLTLLLENIDLEENPHYYMWSIPEAFRIIDEVNHAQVKVLYDFFHAQISGGNLITNLQKHIGKVGLLHVADVPGRHQPGTGEINYINIYKKLAELKYNGYVAMEFHPTGDPVKVLAQARLDALRAAQS